MPEKQDSLKGQDGVSVSFIDAEERGILKTKSMESYLHLRHTYTQNTEGIITRGAQIRPVEDQHP
jgi:hypothetical protein